MPTLTAQEIAQLQAEKAKQENFAEAMLAAVPQKQARAAELAVADGAFKKFFDYYNDDIIAHYDSERKALDGQYIAEPITEDDVLGPATLDGTVRTTPTMPVTDIVRVDEFDGGPLISTEVNETQAIADQAESEDVLKNGYGAGSGFNATTETDSTLSAASTTLKLKDPTTTFSIPNGSVLVVKGTGDLAIVEIVSVTIPITMSAPYEATYAINVIVAPTGTLATGSELDDFTGFTNAERTAKTASDTDYQDLMDYLIDNLETAIGVRQARLAEQLTAIAANQDPDGTAEFATATTNINTSNTFLTAYLVTTDISDTGLASLATERGTRGAQITARVAQIEAAYTGRTENYYDRRYTVANDRANTARGTLRLQKATEESVNQLNAFAAGAQGAIDAMDALLS